MAKMKRSQFATFLNVGDPVAQEGGTPEWALIGEGVTTATVNMNPQTTEEVYIHEDSGTTEIESYRPTFPMEQACVPGDEAYDFIEGLYLSRAVLSDAHAEILNVYLHLEVGEASGEYQAELQPVSIQIDSFGGDGGTTNRINYTINYRGDPVTGGTFDPESGTYTPPGGGE